MLSSGCVQTGPIKYEIGKIASDYPLNFPVELGKNPKEEETAIVRGFLKAVSEKYFDYSDVWYYENRFTINCELREPATRRIAAAVERNLQSLLLDSEVEVTSIAFSVFDFAPDQLRPELVKGGVNLNVVWSKVIETLENSCRWNLNPDTIQNPEIGNCFVAQTWQPIQLAGAAFEGTIVGQRYEIRLDSIRDGQSTGAQFRLSFKNVVRIRKLASSKWKYIDVSFRDREMSTNAPTAKDRGMSTNAPTAFVERLRDITGPQPLPDQECLRAVVTALTTTKAP